MQREKTKVQKNTLNPEYNERLYLMVQEPTSQNLYILVQDVDMVNLKGLLQLNFIKGITNVVNKTSLLGRVAVPLRPITEVRCRARGVPPGSLALGACL